MRFTTQSEYALICLKALGQGVSGRPVSLASLTNQEQMSKDYMEQLFLKLKKAGIVISVKGSQGGYLLAKQPSQITVKAIIEALEGDVYEVFCSPQLRDKIVCMHFDHCSVRPMWMKLKELIDEFLEKVTLADILKDEPSMTKHVNGFTPQFVVSSLSR